MKHAISMVEVPPGSANWSGNRFPVVSWYLLRSTRLAWGQYSL